MRYQVKDQETRQHYYTRVPNIIVDTQMSVHAKTLYLVLKRVAGDDGASWQSTKTLAKTCNMSEGSVSNAKSELVDLGLVLIQKKPNPKGGRKYDEITIVDVWKENYEKYHTSSPHELASSPDEFASSPHELKNNPLRKTQEEFKYSTPAEKPPRAKSQETIALETLEAHFATVRGCPPIDWNIDDPKRLQKLWRSPLKRILNRCGQGDVEQTKDIIEKAIRKMLKDKLTVSTPKSIEQVCEDIAANLKKKETERYYIPEGEELAKQQEEFWNAPPVVLGE